VCQFRKIIGQALLRWLHFDVHIPLLEAIHAATLKTDFVFTTWGTYLPENKLTKLAYPRLSKSQGIAVGSWTVRIAQY